MYSCRLAFSQTFEFPATPTDKPIIDMLKNFFQYSGIMLPIIVYPPLNDRVDFFRNILQFHWNPMIGIPILNGFPYLRPRFLTDCGREVQENFPVGIYRTSWSECVAKKVELDALIGNITMVLLAIDNFRLVFVKFQLALSKPFPYGT